MAAGVTIVTPAGNGAKDVSTFSPANHPDVIAVSTIADSDGKCEYQGDSTSGGADDSLALFSNYGPAIDMATPGVQIYSTSKIGWLLYNVRYKYGSTSRNWYTGSFLYVG